MNKLTVFIICLGVLITIFSMIVCIEIYSLERAMARGFYSDILDDMQDIGYLDSRLEQYYTAKLDSFGWQPLDADYFTGTLPRTATARAKKEQNQHVLLVVRIRPSQVSQWLHYFQEGERDFLFTGSRPSEYFSPEW
ncbi:hypothetical protein LOK74_21675 [Brevibacillus humidisoli]|uniref:hypothetical protein n=1 Tax=Brevibacillus humidisoli TaxID=2895522 RepID=UPI001E523844|nr:hypothetical protein [Brevibacillus humidisoli]UFJ40597.1 hypothetical protein LOK74_21675 [Brevibacillus humidisoli]